MTVQLHHLQYFVALAETLHFGRAAERVHISQPGLSQQLQRLEALLGVQLFQRTHQRVALTEAGQLFLPEARRALEQVAVALRVAQRAARGELGRLSIGYVGSLLYSVLPETIQVFRARFPEVQLQLHELSSNDQLAALAGRQLDLGFLNGPLQDPHLASACIVRERLWVALPHSHPLATRQELALDELRSEPFIMVSPQHEAVVHARHLQLCQAAGFAPHVVQEASQIQTILGLVALGMGVFLVPALVRNIQHRAVAYVPLARPRAYNEFYAVWRSDHAHLVLQRFREILQEVQTRQGNSSAGKS